MDSSAINLDMHRIGKAVAGVVADRNLQNATVGVAIAADDAQAGCALRHAQSLCNLVGRRYCLNVLSHLNKGHASEPLKLPEDGFVIGANLRRRLAQAFMDIGIEHSNGSAIVDARAQTFKVGPSSTGHQTQVFRHALGQGDLPLVDKTCRSVAGVLKNFRNVGERLMQRAAARRRGLDHGAGTGTPRNQAFGLKRAQSLPHSEPADIEPLAQFRFGGKAAFRKGAGENFGPQGFGQFLISRLERQIRPPSCADASA